MESPLLVLGSLSFTPECPFDFPPFHENRPLKGLVGWRTLSSSDWKTIHSGGGSTTSADILDLLKGARGDASCINISGIVP